VNNAVLSCRICETTHPLAPVSRCAACSGPLDVRYVSNGNGSMLADPGALSSDRALLPHRDTAMPNRTPLVPAPRMSAALGVDIQLKLETANPTRSFKDRMAASAVKAAQAFGIETLLCASTGNLGAAVAAYCAAAGLEGVILTPASTNALVLRSGAEAASVFRVNGSLEDCLRLEHELEPLFPWGCLDGNLQPFAVEGIKTIAYEIAEQLNWRTPDAIVSPVASGALFAKLAQGFVELADLGLLSDPPPRMYGAQPGGCPPVAAAWADERPPSRVTPNTVARSLAVGDPSYGELAIGAARMSGGSITAVAEELIEPSAELLAEDSGVVADSAGGVAFGALVELVRSGAIAAGEQVVLVVTGTGVQPRSSGADYRAHEIDADADHFLSALGVGRDWRF
jgi:threonine synthase